MAKPSKKRSSHPDRYDAKPDFAMDDFARERPKKEKTETGGPEAVSVQDRLGESSRSLLERLRREMEAASPGEAGTPNPDGKPAAKVAAAGTGKRPPASRSANEKDDKGPDLTFSEMFDPQPEDDTDFDTLLSDSKLDWRQYK